MVTRARRGSSNTGCLLWLLGFAIVLYYGVQIGQRYFAFYQLQDEMRSQARLAPGMGDAVIRRRIIDKVDALNLTIPPKKIVIKRGGNPPRIRISSEYADTVALPFFRKVFVFKPQADEPL